MSSIVPTVETKEEAKWRKQFQKFMNDSKRMKSMFHSINDFKEQELISPPGLSPTERKILHTLAENANVVSMSKGEGKNRVVIILKEPRPVV